MLGSLDLGLLWHTDLVTTPAHSYHVDSCSEMNVKLALPRADSTASDVSPRVEIDVV